eukprot:COSAG01_NODE_74038_length_229_cov_50.838462_1_plen_41_part_01
MCINEMYLTLDLAVPTRGTGNAAAGRRPAMDGSTAQLYAFD